MDKKRVLKKIEKDKKRNKMYINGNYAEKKERKAQQKNRSYAVCKEVFKNLRISERIRPPKFCIGLSSAI